ncbi:hypothetical protein MtrunA17_Chr3g0127631 [Medicago truncatula]|uniref:Uncharacterized protein n=1 Tax=Medicago truncatula TaxID=3880 RepID=G7J890_MEDTR|nr:hypothetical protein MTR_3g092320 [Medicago truncatula]RHN69699.1 hypothetical protein MtrunA17_Chr3g0127631 [Medicago truncatula]
MTSLHFKSFEEILGGKYRTDLIVGWFLGETDPFFKLDLNYLLCSFFYPLFKMSLELFMM